MKNEVEFRRELRVLINRYSMENGSHTHDFVLADYLVECLRTFNRAVNDRARLMQREQPVLVAAPPTGNTYP